MRKNLHRSNVVLQPLVKVAGRGEGRKKWRIVREEKKGKKEEEKDVVATWSGRESEKPGYPSRHKITRNYAYVCRNCSYVLSLFPSPSRPRRFSLNINAPTLSFDRANYLQIPRETRPPYISPPSYLPVLRRRRKTFDRIGPISTLSYPTRRVIFARENVRLYVRFAISRFTISLFFLSFFRWLTKFCEIRAKFVLKCVTEIIGIKIPLRGSGKCEY